MKVRLGLLLLLLFTGNSAYSQYRFIKPLVVPGSSSTEITAINDAGQMAGNYYDQAGGHAFLWTAQGITTLDQPARVSDLNQQGDMIGMYGPTYDQGFVLHKGVFTTLNYPGAEHTVPKAINGSGTVVGIFSTSRSTKGFVWKDGVFTEYNHPGATDTGLTVINDRGDIAGWWTDINDPRRQCDNFVQTASGNYISINAPWAWTCEQGIVGIGQNGHVFGVYYPGGATGHGYAWADGKFRKFDAPYSTQTTLTNVNERDEVVGYYSAANGGFSGAFLALPEGRH